LRWPSLNGGLNRRKINQKNRLREFPKRTLPENRAPLNGSSETEPKMSAAHDEPRDPLELARYYQSLLESGQFANRAALARFLGVSRARVTQVLQRLLACPCQPTDEK